MQAPEAPTTLPLRDIMLPAEPGYWPLAPGWWVVLAVVLGLLFWAAIKYRKHALKKRKLKAIQQQLSGIQYDFQQHHNKAQLLAEMSVFLRRFVRFQLADHRATSLPGAQWVNYLNQLNPSGAFEPYADALTSGVYQADFEFDAEGLITTTQRLVNRQVMKPAKDRAKEALNV